MVAAAADADEHQARRQRGAGFLQRLGQSQRLPVVVTKQTASMTGPVCVDDFVPTTTTRKAAAEARSTKRALRQYYGPEIVDLDVLSGTELANRQFYHLKPSASNESSAETTLTDSGTAAGTTTTTSTTSSECSTDDSYQSDLRISSLTLDDGGCGGRKRVSFSEVSLRVYAPVVSDSPSAAVTYPIGLDWKHSEAVTLPLEEFEEEKTCRALSEDGDKVVLLRGFRRPRRLSPIDRFHRISDLSGLSHGEIYELEHARARRCVPDVCASTSTTQRKSRSSATGYQIVDIDNGYQCIDV